MTLNPVGQQLQGVWMNMGPVSNLTWFGLAITMVFTAILSATLIYMLSVILSSERLKTFAKAEFLQAAASAIIVIGLVMLVNFAFAEAKGFVCPGGCGTGDTPLDYTMDRVAETGSKLDTLYWNVYNANMGVERAEYSCILLFGVETFCGWDLHPRVEEAHFIGHRIVQLLIAVWAQYALLDFIKNTMLFVFLPAGVLLRIPPFTRGLGGLLIASAIGLYFVYPIFFSVSSLTFQGDTPVSIDSGTTYGCFGGQGGNTRVIAKGFEASGQAGKLYADVNSSLVSLTLEAILYPFIAFAVTIVFIRAMAPVFGGDSAEIIRGVSKLV